MSDFKSINGYLVKDETARTEIENLKTYLESEAEARQTADTNEAEARQTADTNEAESRQAADENLTKLITAETTARENADTELDAKINTAISDEAEARQTADTNEAEARQVADDVLSERIADIAEGLSEHLDTEADRIKVHFPYRNTNAGDCVIIEAYDTVTLIDIGTEESNADLLGYLTEVGISKIDNIIISHYHGDHIGGSTGFASLLNSDIDFSDLTVYLPHGNINWNYTVDINSTGYYTSLKKVYQSIVSAISSISAELVYPEEDDMIYLGNENCSIRFINLTKADFTEYYNHTQEMTYNEENITRYNNFSMVCEMKHFDHVYLFSGDVEELAQSKIYNRISTPDVYKVEHHCLNYSTNSDYLNKINPKHSIICDYYTDFETSKRYSYEKLSRIGDVYSTNVSGNIIVTSNRTDLSVECERGIIDWSDIPTLVGGKGIEPGSDLDTFTTPGTYFSQSSARTQTILNTPIKTSAFKLVVENLISGYSGIRQTYYQGNSKPTNIYTRVQYNGVWYPWNSLNILSPGIEIPEGTDITTLLLPCDYASSSSEVTATLSGLPETVSGGFKLLNLFNTNNHLKQILLNNSNEIQSLYIRNIDIDDNIVSDWYRFSGEVVATT